MNNKVLQTLEYDKIKAQLANLTVSNLGRDLVERLVPMTNKTAIEAALEETTEARTQLDGRSQVPLHGMADLRELVDRVDKGGVLNPTELLRLSDFLRGCREMKRYMGGKRLVAPRLSRYADGITPCNRLEDEITRCIDGARVASSASPQLARIRRDMQITEERIQSKLQSILNSSQYRDALQDHLISFKDGHYVLPVKASHRQKIDGTVTSSSGSGSTVFMEPTVIRNLTNELQALRIEEEVEEYRILATLTEQVAPLTQPIRINLETMAQYDLAFAKGRLSIQHEARAVVVNDRGLIGIRQGRHPLITGHVVPLDFALGKRYHTLVITGPNTGGKTVTLKTVGLLTLMMQSGLHVPVAEGSQLAIFSQVLADIGDGQSIEQSLSTFSSHMGNIAEILNQADDSVLVLLDEVGTGTDPAEGAALAMGILETLHQSGAVTMASTHYSDVKRLADIHPGFINGRMDFDPITLKPLYRLVMGEAGGSHALWIAERLGISAQALAKAREHLLSAPSSARDGEGQRKPVDDVPVVKTVSPVTTAPSPPESDPSLTAFEAGEESSTPRPWALGDSVLILTLDQRGVVAELPNSKGDMVVFSRERRITVNQKRVKLLVGAEHLYPAGYDMKTVLFTWNDRQLMHDMDRKIVDGVRVVSSGDTKSP